MITFQEIITLPLLAIEPRLKTLTHHDLEALQRTLDTLKIHQQVAHRKLDTLAETDEDNPKNRLHAQFQERLLSHYQSLIDKIQFFIFSIKQDEELYQRITSSDKDIIRVMSLPDHVREELTQLKMKLNNVSTTDLIKFKHIYTLVIQNADNSIKMKSAESCDLNELNRYIQLKNQMFYTVSYIEMKLEMRHRPPSIEGLETHPSPIEITALNIPRYEDRIKPFFPTARRQAEASGRPSTPTPFMT